MEPLHRIEHSLYEVLELIDDARPASPTVTAHILQPSLRCRRTDSGRFVIAFQHFGFCEEHPLTWRFVTPETKNDGFLYCRGLEQKTWLHEAFAVFASFGKADKFVGAWGAHDRYDACRALPDSR